MKTIVAALFVFGLAVFMVPEVSAQDRSGVDFFVGYANLQAEGLPDRNQPDPDSTFDRDFFRNRTTLHGANASITGYPTDYFGITVDFSFDRRERTEAVINGEDVFRTDVYYLMAGPTVSIRNPTRVEPFFRVMAGAAHTRFEASSRRDIPPSTGSFDTDSTDFAAAAGGGIDIRLVENLKLRLIQVDWAPVFLRDRTIEVLGGSGVIQPQTLQGQRQDNVRFSVGLVF